MAKKTNDKKPIYDVSWYDDKYQSIVVFRNWMLLITLISIVGIFAMTIASYNFVPLKSVSPFIIQIDEKTGVTEVVDSKSPKMFTANEMLIKHFAHKYIVARESYNWRNLENSRDIVRVMSSRDVWRSYNNNLYDKEAGMVYLFGTHTEREVSLRSSQIRRNQTTEEITVDARMLVTERSASRRPEQYTIAVSMICSFNSAFELNDEERLINPLGFFVTYYSSGREANTQDATQ